MAQSDELAGEPPALRKNHATIPDQVRQFRAADYHRHRCSGGHARAVLECSNRLGTDIAIALVLGFVARVEQQHSCRGIVVQRSQGTDSLLGMGGDFRRVAVRLQRVRPRLFQIQLVEKNPAMAAKPHLNRTGRIVPFHQNKGIVFLELFKL